MPRMRQVEEDVRVGLSRQDALRLSRWFTIINQFQPGSGRSIHPPLVIGSATELRLWSFWHRVNKMCFLNQHI